MQNELAQKTQEVGSQSIELSSLRARVDALTEERDDLEQQVRGRLAQAEAERDAAVSEAASLRDTVESLRAEVADVSARASELSSTLDDTKRSLDRASGRTRILEADVKEKEQEVLKAYQLLKSEEQLREKAKQAAELAVRLLRGDVDAGGGAGLEA